MNNKKIKSKKITIFIILFPLITLILYGSLSYMFFFYIKKQDIQKELIRYEKTLVDIQKNTLIEKVENLTRFIRYYNYKSSNKIKKNIKLIIDLSSNIANNLYHKYKDTMKKEQLKKLIINALNNINFKSHNEYIFVIDIKGNALIHPNKNIKGTNIINLKDINGKYIVKEFMSVLEDNKEGFVDYYWYISNKHTKKMEYKISFVKQLDMYDWYIGTGEFLKFTTQAISSEMLEYIKDNANFKYGHFFISNSKNELIFHPKDKNNSDIDRFRMEGIYEDDKQIAFTAYVAQYDWYITAVKNMSEIRENINKLKMKNEIKFNNDIKTNSSLIITTLILSLIFSLYLSSIVNKMLKKYEDEIKNSNDKLIFQSRQALIGELFSMIAHQWRQPINKIASIIVYLRFNLSSNNKNILLDKKLQEIENSIEFMSETIDDFRTFYKPKNIKENINLANLIIKAISFIQDNINKKNISLLKNIKNINYNIYSNEFLQVIINIINNACDAVKQNGTIQIDLYEKDNIIYLNIKDDGIGIQKELLQKVFDPYFSTKKDSMGLGLYMCKMIVQKHLNGDIKVQSNKNEGTIFKLRFYRQS